MPYVRIKAKLASSVTVMGPVRRVGRGAQSTEAYTYTPTNRAVKA